METKKKNEPSGFLKKILALPEKVVSLESGKMVRFIVGWCLRLCSIAIIFAALKYDYKIVASLKWKMAISSLFGGGLSVLGISFVAYFGAAVLFLRSGRILAAVAAGNYPMLYLFAEIIQIVTEIFGVMIILFSVFFGFLFVLLNFWGGSLSFLSFFGGFYGWFSLFYFFLGIALLLFGHAFREFLNLLVRIEVNTRKK
ncbi:MAG: hypothetical protein ABUK01_16080 [Leptospirales bacterium]